MYKLWATLIKDVKLLTRDRVGLSMMFGMPIVLAVVITSLQSGAFELINENKLALIVCNKDSGVKSTEFIKSIEDSKHFKITFVDKNTNTSDLKLLMHKKEILVAVEIPENFSKKIIENANQIASKALQESELNTKIPAVKNEESISMLFQPVLQKAHLETINASLSTSLQVIQNKQILNAIYMSINGSKIDKNLENEIVNKQVKIKKISTSKAFNRNIPNATQHNIPAWTIFAMFFIVTSLGSIVVKERISGSFIRLKTLPTNFYVSLLSKQITYVIVCLLQVFIIFSIGVYLFPILDLPKLNMPFDLFSLALVSLVCAWCAVSYAICVGIFAKTQEQANGFGAISIVILSALGGLLVPGFAMSQSFQNIIALSPLHWCLEAYYDLFLEGANFKDVLKNLAAIFGFTLLIQVFIIFRLKKLNLI